MNNKKYDYIAISGETGIAKVKNIDGEWGLVEIGKEICEPKYDYISRYKNGFALVEKKGKWGYIDIKGKEICEPKYRLLQDAKKARNSEYL